MTKEELVGRKFIHKDIPWQVIAMDDETISYQRVEDKSSGSCAISRFKEMIGKGTWKLLPEEDKMHVTSGGIKYGVGSKFAHKEGGAVYTFTDISGEYPKFWCYNNSTNTTKSEFNTSTLSSYSKYRIDKYFDEGTWLIIQDYQSVDPTTIKFDFTNTKWLVGNQMEYDWVTKAANNNGWTNLSSDYSRHSLYFWDDKDIAWGNLIDWKEEDKYKEITIQDILNSNQMNNKLGLEVGDIVDTTVSKNIVVTAVDINKGVMFGTNGGYDEWSWVNEKVKLVSKGSKQEIIRYELLKDLPGIPAGTKTKSISTYEGLFEGIDAVFTFSTERLQDTTWFKPIYKAKDITLKFSKYNATLSKELGLVFTDNERLSFTEVQKLVKVLANREGKTVAGKYDVVIKQKLESVSVGCKLFTPKDVELVTKAVQELQ